MSGSDTERGQRVKVLSLKQVKRSSKLDLFVYEPGERLAIDENRPKTRADCINGCRPCPYVACRHHLFLDVNEDSGSLRFNFPDKEIEDLQQTCSLDVADDGPKTLEHVGGLTNLTRERVRQVEIVSMDHVKKKMKEDV